MSQTTADAHGDGHDDDHDHYPVNEYPYVAHHFDSPEHQFEAGKFGIWLFLVTEVLFFSGLFCAYAIYRAMRPEVFEYAHYYLDKNLGALNTIVLLVSSFTAAWAVRAARLRQKNLLMLLIVITIGCAFTFMGVKYFEYSHKFHDQLLWGLNFNPAHPAWELPSFQAKHPELYAKIQEALAAGGPEAAAKVMPQPANTHVFFSIYFFMTGLHGVHVIGGIVVWIWMLIKAAKNQFGPKYFGPIDFAALYWHLVDLVWIYLFPLLYLIS